jgi:hypothetical protein
MSPESGFLLQDQIVPRLQSAVPYAVNCVGCEDAEEIIQDGTALAAKMIHNAELAGKRVVQSASNRSSNQGKQVTAGNVAYFVIVKLRNGCRSSGMVTADVYGAGTQINGRTRLTSLDDVAAQDEENGGEIFEFHDVISRDEEDPATRAARKMDWDVFMAGLCDRDQAIIECVVQGDPLTTLARRRGLNCSTLRYHKDRLAKAITEFMGFDILAQVQRRPQWKDSLDSTRERMAVRYDRCH